MQESWRNDPDKLTFIICQPLAIPAGQDPLSHVKSKMHDSADQMIGDVNLFLSLSSEVQTNPNYQHANEYSDQARSNPPSDYDQSTTTTVQVTGELELMIANSGSKRKGYGRAALATFICYILTHQSEIIGELLNATAPSELLTTTQNRDQIHQSSPAPPTTTSTSSSAALSLTAKISSTNTASLSLFQSLGFTTTATEPNYFGEWELRLPATMYGGGSNPDSEWEKELERWEVPAWREMRYGR